MGNAVKKVHSEDQEKYALERANGLWKKIKMYSCLIARLKISTKEESKGSKKRMEDLDKDAILPFWERLVIDPENKKKKIFDVIMSCLVLLDILLTSWTVFVKSEIGFLNYFLTGLFFIDIILDFFQGYFAGTQRILKPSRIVISYLKSHFIIDLLATFPFFAIDESLYFFRFFRLFRFPASTTHIISFISYTVIENLISINKATLAAIDRLLGFLLSLLIFLHIFACAWVNMGREPKGWVGLSRSPVLFSSDDDTTIYTAALYWAVTTFATVGYGDIVGLSTNDYWYTMGIFLFGVCMFSYLLGNVNGLIAQLNYADNLKRQREEELEDWLLHIDRAGKNRHVTNKQCKFIVTYLENYWSKNIKGIDDQPEFVQQLPPSIRKRLFTSSLFEEVRGCYKRFFAGLHPEFIKDLILKMQYSKIMKENEFELSSITVLKAGKVPHWIYFIWSNSLTISSVDECTKYISLTPGGVYGEVYAFFGIKASYSLLHDSKSNNPQFAKRVNGANPEKGTRAATSSGVEVYRVNADDYLNLIKYYPEHYAIFRQDALKKRKIYRAMKRDYLSGYSEIRRIIGEMQENQGKNPNDPGENQIDEKANIRSAIEEVKGKVSKILFREKKWTLNHKEMLLLEYDYNSEDEFGTDDVFHKSEVVAPTDTIQEKIEELESKLEKVKAKLNIIDLQTNKYVEKIQPPQA